MRSASPSRWSAVSRFESSSPCVSKPSPSTTAPASTGPQSAPRPPSSLPATPRQPSDLASSSNRDVQESASPWYTRGRRLLSTRSFAAMDLRSGNRPAAPASTTVCHGTTSGAPARPRPPAAPALPTTRLHGDRGPLLLHASRLALALAQVVELGPADLGLLHDLDLLDRLRVEGEDALDALAERDLAHGDRGPRPAAPQPDHDAFEDLHALALGLLGLRALRALGVFLDRGLLDPHVHAHGVARGERGEALLQVRGLDAVDGIHFSLPISVRFPKVRERSRLRSRAGAGGPPESAARARGGRAGGRGSRGGPRGGASGGSSRGRRRGGPRVCPARARPRDGCSGDGRGGRPRRSRRPRSPR